ncbi:MAG TPA: hypothetical protein DGH68_06875 [Bacteroidetes bacterium]|nr:hypothetical protein [Bacteroidota bacterium]
MKQLEYVLANETEVLTFLKSKYPLYHLSNVFFRDIQYGIQTFFFRKKMSVGYTEAEKIARAFVAQLEKKKTLNPIDQQSWVLNHPEFRKPSVAPAVPPKPAAKPVGTAPAVQGAAAATPAATKPSLPPINRPAAVASPKPGGLPPLSRPAAGTATAKPGGLPPLKSAATAKASTQSTAPTEAPTLAAVNPTPATIPVPDPPKAEGSPVIQAASSVAPGEKKPLPPLQRATPAGPKKA